MTAALTAPAPPTVAEPVVAPPAPPIRLERHHWLAALAVLVVFFAPYQTLVQTVLTDDAVRKGLDIDEYDMVWQQVGYGVGVLYGVFVGLWLSARIGPAVRGLRLVVPRLEVSHLPGGLLGPLWVTRAVGDDGPDRQPGSQLRPAVVLLNRDAHRHALHDLGELAGDDVARHQGELRPGRFVDPDHASVERLGEGVQLQLHRVARGHAGQARQPRLLPAQLRAGGVHLAAGDVDLVAVGYRVDLR